MAEKQQRPTVEEMFGIAKKFALQLKDFPLETESAIVEMVRVSMQHRSLQEQKAHNLAEMALKERHIEMQQKQFDLQRMAYERESSQIVASGLRAQQACAVDEVLGADKQLREHEVAGAVAEAVSE